MSVYVNTAESVVIAINTTTSGAICIQDYNAGSLQVPSAITGATLTVSVSNDGTNYTSLQDAAGVAIAAIPVTANEACPLPAGAFNFKWMKLVSASSEAAARTIPLLLKAA